MDDNKHYRWYSGPRPHFACNECGWTKGKKHQDNCKVAEIEALESRLEKAEAACRKLMEFEYFADGDEDGSSENKYYWPAVGLAREAVGDYKPESEEDDGRKD